MQKASRIITRTTEAIFFDLDGTLRHSRPNANELLIEQAIALGAPCSPEKALEAARWAHYYWAQSHEMYADYQEHTDDDAFWQNYIKRYLVAYGCSETSAGSLAPVLQQYMEEHYNPENYVPGDVFETLNLLKHAGITLGLVSNRSKPIDGLMKELAFEPLFDFYFVAGQIDIWKPEPGIFTHALELAGSQAENTLYVGDNYYADILGAQNAGLIPLLYDPKGVFPQADCITIEKISDIPPIIFD